MPRRASPYERCSDRTTFDPKGLNDQVFYLAPRTAFPQRREASETVARVSRRLGFDPKVSPIGIESPKRIKTLGERFIR